MHHRDTEAAEETPRTGAMGEPLCALCGLCASVVNFFIRGLNYSSVQSLSAPALHRALAVRVTVPSR